MLTNDWEAFEKYKRPAGMPWPAVNTSTTPFDPSVHAPRSTEDSAINVHRLLVRHLTSVPEPALGFLLEPKRFEFAEALIRIITFQDPQDIDSSPIRGFLRERLRDARNAANHAASDAYPKMAARLNELICFAEEDWPEVEIPSGEAIRSLSRVLTQIGNVADPGVTLSNQGQLWAEWENSNGRVALIVGSEGVPAIAALLPDKGTLGRHAHFNFYGSEDEVVSRLLADPKLRQVIAR